MSERFDPTVSTQLGKASTGHRHSNAAIDAEVRAGAHRAAPHVWKANGFGLCAVCGDTRASVIHDEPPLHVPASVADREAAPGDMPEIVCLCGSTRFHEAFQRRNYEETMAGRIVLSVGFYVHAPEMIATLPGGALVTGKPHGGDIGCTAEQKIALDELHKRKIDLASRVIVLNVGGYVGESTESEIAYAIAHHKRLTFLEPRAGEEYMSKRSHELGALIAKFSGFGS